MEFIGFFPILFDLCGVPQLPNVEAISMIGLLKKPDMAWKKGAITLTAGTGNATIGADRYRYGEDNAPSGPLGSRKSGGVALFDHVSDPGEFYNGSCVIVFTDSLWGKGFGGFTSAQRPPGPRRGRG